MRKTPNLTDTTPNFSKPVSIKPMFDKAFPRSSNGKTADSDSAYNPRKTYILRNLTGICSPCNCVGFALHCELLGVRNDF